MSRRGSTLVVASGLAVVLGLLGASLPVPYVGLGPGPVFDTLGTVAPEDDDAEPIIRISGTRTYDAEGRLDLTTVSVFGASDQKLSLSRALRYWFDRDYAVVPTEVIYPEDKSPAEVEQQVEQEMLDSQQSAVAAALRELAIPAKTTVVVQSVLDGSPAAAALRKDDVIVSVDGMPASGAEAVRTVLRRRQPGDPVRVSYRRAGATRTASLNTVSSGPPENRPVIGVELREESEYPFAVTIDPSFAEEVGGPSAGLMLAVGIIEQLTPGSLTGGAHVAGTGTIDEDGAVGPIGGIQQKLIAAERAGADFFLVPAGNMADARRATPDGLELREVATLDDALAALAEIRASR